MTHPHVTYRLEAAHTESHASGLVDEIPDIHQWGTEAVYIEECRGYIALVADAQCIADVPIDKLVELYAALGFYLAEKAVEVEL